MESKFKRTARTASRILAIGFALTATTYIVLEAHKNANPEPPAKPPAATKELHPANNSAFLRSSKSIADPLVINPETKFLFSSKSAIVPGIRPPASKPTLSTGDRHPRARTYLHSSKSFVLTPPAKNFDTKQLEKTVGHGASPPKKQ